MTRGMIKALAGVGAAALLLAACSSEDGGDGNNDDGSGDSAAADMQSWDACEVLGDLQPIVDFTDLTWTATKAEGRPDSTPWGQSSRIPDALVCGGSIDLPTPDSMPATGGVVVGITPIEDEAQATAVYDEHVVAIGQQGDVDVAQMDLGDPWDSGTLLARANESGATEYVGAVALEGSFLVHIIITYSADLGLYAGEEPNYPFTNDELHQWLAETYMPSVNQAINDKI